MATFFVVCGAVSAVTIITVRAVWWLVCYVDDIGLGKSEEPEEKV